MRYHKREIVIFILTALATLSAVYYFFITVKEGKRMAQTDLYALTAPDPTAILAVNRPSVFTKTILGKEAVHNAFASQIPAIYLRIIRENPDIPLFHISFHPQGVVMYAKAGRHTAGNLQEKSLKHSFKSFAPQQQIKDEVTFTYYPDSGNRFFGCFQHNGIWVGSYSKKLLEEVSRLQQKQKDNQPDEYTRLRKSLDNNAPLNLLIRAEALDLFAQANDSIQWYSDDEWLGADIFESKGHICYFSIQPSPEPVDTLLKTIGDTLSVRLEQFFPQLRISNQVYEENGKIYFTGTVSPS